MGVIMVAVSKKYVKLAQLTSTIEELLKTYVKIQVEYPSNIEYHFLVKAWKKKPESDNSGGAKRPSS